MQRSPGLPPYRMTSWGYPLTVLFHIAHHGIGSLLCAVHSVNHRLGTSYHIPSCENTGPGCHVVLVHDQHAAFGRFETIGGTHQLGLGHLRDGDDGGISFHQLQFILITDNLAFFVHNAGLEYGACLGDVVNLLAKDSIPRRGFSAPVPMNTPA